MKLKKCGFTGRFDLFWLQSVQLKRDSLYLRLECFHFLAGYFSPDHVAVLPCPLTFLLQLVIMPHQLNLCSIGFLYILGKGIWKLSNVVVVMLKVQNYKIHLVSMNPETKFSFMFSWEKGHKTKMIVDYGHLKWTLMPYSFSSRVVACLPQTYIGFMAKQTKHPSPKTFEEAANYDP